MSCFDCELMPKLQHIRVAGAALARDDAPTDDMSHGAGPVEDRTDMDQTLKDGRTTNLLDGTDRPLTGGAASKMRMINVVLVEPGVKDAPIKRRRGRGKRSTCPKIQGTLKEYFSKIVVPKELSVVKSTVEGALLRKRKGEALLVEDHKRLMLTDASRCLLVEDDGNTCGIEDSRTLCPIFMGAKSRNGRDTTGKTTKVSGNGLELIALTKGERGTSLGLDERKTKNRINSQTI